jgi:Mce-associated membrane protein
MGDDSQGRGGDDVTTSSDTSPDVRKLLEQAEAEAADAEAAAARARARVREMRGEEEETVPAELASEKTRRFRFRITRPRRSVVGKTLATLVIIGSLVGSGIILWKHHESSARNERAAAFAAAASQGVTALTSLDFRHAKEDVQRIVDNSTGSFRDDYAVRSEDFVKVVEASKVIARGTVTAAAVQSMTGDDAVVLVAASEEITNAAGNKQPRAYRFRVTVTRDGYQLKLSKVELVP